MLYIPPGMMTKSLHDQPGDNQIRYATSAAVRNVATRYVEWWLSVWERPVADVRFDLDETDLCGGYRSLM